MTEITVGTRIGHYEIQRSLGRGGTAEVFRAHDLILDRPVALKVLDVGPQSQAWKAEAQIGSALNHPNLMTVYDAGIQNDRAWIATEAIDGVTLRDLISAGARTVDESVAVVAQLLTALEAFGGVGFVHGDLKPENVMVRRDGWVKLIDFGIAGQAGEERPTEPVRGTFPYVSPERMQRHSFDQRADLWSVGVILFELLVGEVPFQRQDRDPIAGLLGPTPLPGRRLPDLDRDLDRIVARALAINPNRRFQSPREFLDELGLSDSTTPSPALGVARTGQGHSRATAILTTSALIPATNLPDLQRVVGRDLEVDWVRDNLTGSTRLITLSGPGGVGKTTLALAAARNLLPNFPGGVFHVDLAEIPDPSLIPMAIALATGRDDLANASLQELATTLSGPPILLVLDNFEQLISATVNLTDFLLSTRGLRLLVTSREVLNLAGEVELNVPPLGIPSEDSPLDDIADSPSVRLFVQRARRVLPDFQLTPDNAVTLAAICARLDGLPLAIELAAARVKLIGPEQILERLKAPLKLLTGGPRDLPHRQRTMRGALQWGYDLLNEKEKRTFRQLGVMVRDFSLSEAEALLPADLVDDALLTIGSLVDKSLLGRATSFHDQPRFHLLTVVRELAREELASTGEFEAACERQAANVDALVRAATGELKGPTQRDWLEKLDKEMGAIRAVLRRARESGQRERALELGASLWWFWYVRGHYREGRRQLEVILDSFRPPTGSRRAECLLGAGALAFLQCDYDDAQSHLVEAADAARSLGDRRTLASALHFRASVARERGDCPRAIGLLGECQDLWQELGDHAEVARCHNYRAMALWLQGQTSAALTECLAAEAVFLSLGDREGLVWSYLSQAMVAHLESSSGRCLEMAEAALEASNEVRFQEGVGWARNIRGLELRRLGRLDDAFVELSTAWEIQRRIGDLGRLASLSEALAGVECDREDHPAAARLLGLAGAVRRRIGAPVPDVERSGVDRTRGRLDRLESLAAAMEEGAAMAEAPPKLAHLLKEAQQFAGST